MYIFVYKGEIPVNQLNIWSRGLQGDGIRSRDPQARVRSGYYLPIYFLAMGIRISSYMHC
jgi:hypothetical protein